MNKCGVCGRAATTMIAFVGRHPSGAMACDACRREIGEGYTRMGSGQIVLMPAEVPSAEAFLLQIYGSDLHEHA